MLEKRLRRRHPLVQIILDNWFYILILIFLWRFPHIIADWTGSEVAPESPRTPSESKFWQGIMIEVFILAILAISYNLLFGFTGIISFGHGLFFGTGAYVTAILVSKYELSLTRSVLAAIFIGVLLGLIWALAAFRIKGVYFAMFTLAFAEIFFQLSRLTIFDEFTRGDDGLTWTVPEWISPIRNRLQLYNIALVLLVFSFLLVRRLMHSPSGKVLLALRENESRAETLGFNIYMYKTLAIVISSILATISGILHVILNRQVAPSALGLDRTVDPLIMTLIGGTGTIPGPVIGAGLLRIGEEFLRDPELVIDLNFKLFRYTTTINSEQYWALALGSAFILFVMLVPYGFVGALQSTWLNIRHWLRNYFYNPVVRSRPTVATWIEPVTGEPPEVAIAIANASTSDTVIEWAFKYPHELLTSILFAVPILVGLIQFDWRPAATAFLFLLIIIVPLRLVLWGVQRLGYLDLTETP